MSERVERLMEPVALLDDDDLIPRRTRCRDCAGTRMRPDQPPVRCRECGRDYSDVREVTPEEYRRYWTELPCGHPWESLTQPDACRCCGGLGYTEQWVNLGAVVRLVMAEMARTVAAPKIVPVTARKRTRTRKAPVKAGAA